jgi:hypothetical protein
MKRSEMVKALQDRFNTTDVDAIADLADEIIAFLESQGMQPPPVLNDSNLFGQLRYYEWEDEE